MAKRGNKKELLVSLPEQCFWVNNGPILSDLKELHSAFTHEISKEQFEHHVHDGRNDFADWVENILGDSECAKQMRSVKRQSTMATKIEGCLKGYK